MSESKSSSSGSHAVGTAVGAAAGGVGGGAAVGAAAGAAAGPVGIGAGAAVGAVVGGLAGRGIAEAVNPTEEDAYWRENHGSQAYGRDRSYDDYRDAYRTGYEGYGRYGTTGSGFEDYEDTLRTDYERTHVAGKLSWDQARPAAQAAWQRLMDRTTNSQRLIGFQVQDAGGRDVGKVHNLWVDDRGQPMFLGVKTGWLFGKNHIVPVGSAEVNERREVVRVPFSEETIKNAPSFDENADISDSDEQTISLHYGIDLSTRRSAGSGTSHEQTGLATTDVIPESTVRTTEGELTGERTIGLKEEQVKIGKREIESGGVRLRKVVRTETVNQPVELRREEIVIERVPVNETTQAATGVTAEGFKEEDIFIPLRREEPVVQKAAILREQVRVGKRAELEHQEVSEQVRREELEIDRNAKAKR